jgi:hypothetical protein
VDMEYLVTLLIYPFPAADLTENTPSCYETLSMQVATADEFLAGIWNVTANILIIRG